MRTLIRDTRHALGGLAKAPAFTLTAVLLLALGIGATTAVFTLVYTVMLGALPVANPEELYRLGRQPRCCYVGGYSQDEEFSLVSYELYEYLRDNTRGFSSLAAFQALPNRLFGVRRSGAAEPARSYPGELVSGNYFAMFGIEAHAGRMLTVEDDRPGAPPVAVISHRLWQQEYAADPAIVGSVFDVNGQPFTVAGVTPPEFFGDTLRSRPPDFFFPLNTEPLLAADAELNNADTHWLNVIGRIEAPATAVSIEAQMRVALKQWLRSHWDQMSPNDRAAFDRQTLYLSPGGAGIPTMRVQYEQWLQILMMISGFVLLIVCANMANLMLVRGIKRRPQTALRVALGAPTAALVRQTLTESVLLSSFGGAAGFAVALAGTRLILHFGFPAAEGFAGTPFESPSIPVLVFAFAVSLATGVAFGVAPAWIAARAEPIEALRGGSRTARRTGSLPRKALVVLQAALSLVLLCATGLLSAALYELEHQDFGFAQDRRFVVRVEPRLAGYVPAQLPALYGRIREEIASIPGVASVALALYSPQSGNRWGARVWIDGQPAPEAGAINTAWWNRVTSGYLNVIGNPIVRGRGLSDQDTATSRRVAVVNEAFAQAYFPNEEPVGKHFGLRPDGPRQFEVVGIAKNALNGTENPGEAVQPFFFLPEAQAPYAEADLGSLFLHDIIILTEPGATVSLAQVRSAMTTADPDMPIIVMRTLEDQVAGQFTQQRVIARLTSLFGAIALVLSCIGLYGLTAYNVASRTSEIAMRVALGADRDHILGLILRGALGLVVCGLAIGLPIAFGVGRLLESQLYGLSSFDPAITLGGVVALSVSALGAALIPAFRATRVSPIEALRFE
jgi:predicted permease